MQYKIYALALPFDLRCESGTLPDIAREISRYCDIPGQYQAIPASQGNMHNKHRVVPLNSHAKVVYIKVKEHGWQLMPADILVGS